MAKAKSKSIKKQSYLVLSIVLVVAYLLMATMFFLPVINHQVKTAVGNADVVPNDMYSMLEASGIKDSVEKLTHASDKAKVSYTTFFLGELSGSATFYAVMCLITAIVAVLGILVAIATFLKPKMVKYSKYYGLLAAIVSITTFIAAMLVVGGTSSGTLASLSITLAVAPILALVGGLVAAVMPYVLKK